MLHAEDGLIAFTWWHYLTQDPTRPEWLARFPMVKAGCRAMDVMTAFGKQQLGLSLDYFMVAGASKRGWNTWLVGAVDSTGPFAGRVSAIVPIVLDAINFGAQPFLSCTSLLHMPRRVIHFAVSDAIISAFLF